MDVNYSRWMSKDPDAVPDPVVDEPRRFRLPRPPRSVVATGVMLALVVLGGGALSRSLTTSDASSVQEPTEQTPSADESDGPGAASVEDNSAPDSTTTDDGASSDTSDDSVSDRPDGDRVIQRPDGPRMIERRRFGPASDMRGPPPAPRPDLRSFPAQREFDQSEEDDEDDD
jgi:hypothetical protein